jgi:hypothetical protein
LFFRPSRFNDWRIQSTGVIRVVGRRVGLGKGPDYVHKATGAAFTVGWLMEDVPGFRRMAQCLSCSALFPLPVKELVVQFGADAPLDQALASLSCPHCHVASVGVTMVKR